jgi:2-polyprenyl-3-methyl-5-hydroxy-6-metoxy-1,4-benzoquinol methylase
MAMTPDAAGTLAAGARAGHAPRQGRAKAAVRHVLNTLGYSLARKDRSRFDCPSLPLPSPELVARADSFFANRFDISPKSGLSEDAVAARVKDYYWHYPFQFGRVFVDADEVHFQGLDGRHRQRYRHIFPPLLGLTAGSLQGLTVLDIACNAGFWSLQARRAGAASVRGVDVSAKNVEQAEFVRDVAGIDGVEYSVCTANDVSAAKLGQFDVSFFLGLLYHLDRPFEALERLHEVTRRYAVVDTTLARSDVPDGMPILKLEEDVVHAQNVSNRVALVPSKAAVPMMLKHAGFKDVFWVRNASSDLPLDYRTGARMTFIAVR